MAETTSKQVALGTKAPDFKIGDVATGKSRTLDQLKGNEATVIMFICNHCPYVKHVNEELIRIANDYGKKGVNFVAISSNDIESHPEDGPEQMLAVSEELGYPFPYLFDHLQAAAKAYGAQCTPDIFVYDRKLKLVYHGQVDDSRPDNGVPVTGKDLRAALHAVVTMQPPVSNQKPAVGCSIKWKA